MRLKIILLFALFHISGCEIKTEKNIKFEDEWSHPMYGKKIEYSAIRKLEYGSLVLSHLTINRLEGGRHKAVHKSIEKNSSGEIISQEYGEFVFYASKIPNREKFYVVSFAEKPKIKTTDHLKAGYQHYSLGIEPKHIWILKDYENGICFSPLRKSELRDANLAIKFKPSFSGGSFYKSDDIEYFLRFGLVEEKHNCQQENTGGHFWFHSGDNPDFPLYALFDFSLNKEKPKFYLSVKKSLDLEKFNREFDEWDKKSIHYREIER